jgi:hypothetical protein
VIQPANNGIEINNNNDVINIDHGNNGMNIKEILNECNK